MRIKCEIETSNGTVKITGDGKKLVFEGMDIGRIARPLFVEAIFFASELEEPQAGSTVLEAKPTARVAPQKKRAKAPDPEPTPETETKEPEPDSAEAELVKEVVGDTPACSLEQAKQYLLKRFNLRDGGTVSAASREDLADELRWLGADEDEITDVLEVTPIAEAKKCFRKAAMRMAREIIKFHETAKAVTKAAKPKETKKRRGRPPKKDKATKKAESKAAEPPEDPEPTAEDDKEERGKAKVAALKSKRARGRKSKKAKNAGEALHPLTKEGMAAMLQDPSLDLYKIVHDVLYAKYGREDFEDIVGLVNLGVDYITDEQDGDVPYTVGEDNEETELWISNTVSLWEDADSEDLEDPWGEIDKAENIGEVVEALRTYFGVRVIESAWAIVQEYMSTLDEDGPPKPLAGEEKFVITRIETALIASLVAETAGDEDDDADNDNGED